MKNLALISALLFSFNALATGGFSCEATAKPRNFNGKEIDVTFYATTSRIYGSPMVSPLKVLVNGVEKLEITKDFITGYWNNNRMLQIVALDENYENVLFELNYFQPTNIGVLNLSLDKNKYIAHNVTCDFE